MELILTTAVTAASQVAATFASSWPYLAGSVAVAAAMKSFVDERQISRFLQRHRRGGVIAATAAAVATPLCSCGTTAIVLGMMATVAPWGPIIAFMVASPLTSPQELLYSAALFGWPFAIAFLLASIVLGLVGGAVAMSLDRRGLLSGQARVQRKGGCCDAAPSCCETEKPSKLRLFGSEFVSTGKQLAFFFFAFAFLGYFVNALVPREWISLLFGGGSMHGVPLAATLGIPFYFNSEASMPLLRPMIDSGMSAGAALAFLVTGAGTSLGAIAGAMTIARWRVIAVVIVTLWTGAIVLGVLVDAAGITA
jgi:uncharacterized protein